MSTQQPNKNDGRNQENDRKNPTADSQQHGAKGTGKESPSREERPTASSNKEQDRSGTNTPSGQNAQRDPQARDQQNKDTDRMNKPEQGRH